MLGLGSRNPSEPTGISDAGQSEAHLKPLDQLLTQCPFLSRPVNQDCSGGAALTGEDAWPAASTDSPPCHPATSSAADARLDTRRSWMLKVPPIFQQSGQRERGVGAVKFSP